MEADTISFKRFGNTLLMSLRKRLINCYQFMVMICKDGLEKSSRDLNFDFAASKKSIWKFKSANRICSRKITKFLTSRYKQESEHIAATAQLFVDSALIAFSDYSPNQIFNTDQSGFNYEIYSGRTLPQKGQKEVLSTVISIHAITHSLTIQPTISLDGRLLSPLFLCIQEGSGEFGIRTQVYRPENVAVYCSSSGKMSKGLAKSWFLDSFMPSMDTKALLLLDSWTGQSDRKMFEDLLTDDKTINILKIPPKTTSLVQPLDYFFRQESSGKGRKWSSVVSKCSAHGSESIDVSHLWVGGLEPP